MSARVAIVMGSKSDWPTMEEAANMLDILGVEYTAEVVSAHRTPDKMFRFAEQAANKGIKVIIAGAGGAAHLPGMIAAKTIVPVLGVPVQSKALSVMYPSLMVVNLGPRSTGTRLPQSGPLLGVVEGVCREETVG